MNPSVAALICLSYLIVSCLALPSASNDDENIERGRKYYNNNKYNVYSMMTETDKRADIMPQEKSSFWSQIASQILQYIVKIFSPNGDTQEATRQLVGMMVSMLDGMRNSYKARNGEARSQESNALAMAGADIVKAYLKSLTEEEDVCVQKYICEANQQAVTESNEAGYVLAQAGSYATSYLLEHFRHLAFDKNHIAAKEGRSGANCAEIYNKCTKSLN